MAVTESDLRRAVARFAAGVTIVGSTDAEGQPRGMTVSAFLFVSFEPALIVVSLLNGVPTLDAALHSEAFGVSILHVDQQALSDRFAGEEEGRFENLRYEAGQEGEITLPGAVAMLDCGLDRAIALGDHTLLVGLVHSAAFKEGPPLLYYRGSYGSFHSLSASHMARWPAEEDVDVDIVHQAAYWH